jgi:SAM-dependent methyltransferase
MNTLVKQLKENNQDFEFYPTTNEILRQLNRCLPNTNWGYSPSILDIGAGSGKVLESIRSNYDNAKCFGIEKSDILRNQWSIHFNLAGVDFNNVTLVDKEYDIIFCNPPYKEYVQWVTKIIKEASCKSKIFLVTPERWKNNRQIKDALESRYAKTEVLGEFSFKDAEDRAARAKVDLLLVKYKEIAYNTSRSTEGNSDPFAAFFDDNFDFPKPKKREFKDTNDNRDSLIGGRNLIDRLTEAYDVRMNELHKNCNAVCELSYDLLKELEISKGSLIELLKNKLKHTKKEFWQSLFNSLDKLKERLTKKSRQLLVNKLNDNTGLDFNTENAYAVISWAIRHYSQYADAQFVDTFEKMVSLANIDNYKSNQRVFDQHNFRYSVHRETENPYRDFKLKTGHRIVLENCGGLDNSPWSIKSGLSSAAADFLSDIMTIANVLHFYPKQKHLNEYEWNDSKERIYTCSHNGEEKLLFKVRAFKNGNLHIHFDPSFIHTLNLIYGKLKGWLNNEDEAEKEAGIPKQIIDKYFRYSFAITQDQLFLQ